MVDVTSMLVVAVCLYWGPPTSKVEEAPVVAQKILLLGDAGIYLCFRIM